MNLRNLDYVRLLLFVPSHVRNPEFLPATGLINYFIFRPLIYKIFYSTYSKNYFNNIHYSQLVFIYFTFYTLIFILSSLLVYLWKHIGHICEVKVFCMLNHVASNLTTSNLVWNKISPRFLLWININYMIFYLQWLKYRLKNLFNILVPE